MKIRELKIHNYRSIAEQTIRFGDYSLLIGPNNSGKSNVLDALRTLYQKDLKFDSQKDFPKFTTADQETWIEIHYELSNEEAAMLPAKYLLQPNSLRVRSWFWPADKAKQGVFAYEGDTLPETTFHGAKNVGEGKLGNVIYIPAVSRLEEHTKRAKRIARPHQRHPEAHRQVERCVQHPDQRLREVQSDNQGRSHAGQPLAFELGEADQ